MDLSKAKVCIPTSSGGHLTHMRMLMPALSKAADRFWVTFDKEDANTALADERVYHCFFPTNRNVKNTLRNTLLAVRILRRERPRPHRELGCGNRRPVLPGWEGVRSEDHIRRGL